MWFFYLLAVLGGVGTGLQPGLNATMRGTLGQPFVAGLVSVAGTAASLLAIGLLLGQLKVPGAERWSEVPWWAWFGGLMGTALILAQVYGARAIGAGPFLSITVGTAVLTSLALDHFGLVGFVQHGLNAGRVAGAALIVGGVLLISLF